MQKPQKAVTADAQAGDKPAGEAGGAAPQAAPAAAGQKPADGAAARPAFVTNDPFAANRPAPAPEAADKPPTAPATPAAAAAQPASPAKPADKPKHPGDKPAEPAPPDPTIFVAPPARKARMKLRHYMIVLSFLLMVALPVGLAAWYLWTRAADQYASYTGFSVRSESASAPSEILGGLGNLMGVSGSSSTDTDVLFKFMQSHDLVTAVDEKLDLQAIWSKPENDPYFAYNGDGSREALLDEWQRKVRVYYDLGMIELRVLAFDPVDAQNIATAILEESTVLINNLNEAAREDMLRYSREDLDQALDRLRTARLNMTEFRNQHRMVDPTADVAGQVGVVASLQEQLAQSLIELGMLQSNAQSNDPRISQAELRVRVIRDQIDAERGKIGSETSNGEMLSDVVGQFESLTVDRVFAEQAYTAARAAYDGAVAEAQRQTRYLAAYVKPTLAEEAEYPERQKLLAIIGGFLLLIWLFGVLSFYSLRDRR